MSLKQQELNKLRNQITIQKIFNKLVYFEPLPPPPPPSPMEIMVIQNDLLRLKLQLMTDKYNSECFKNKCVDIFNSNIYNTNHHQIIMADNAEVKKLDMPSQFNAIKTNMKSTSSLKKHENERYSVWFNYYKENKQIAVPKNKSSILWVAKHWKTIEKYIKDTYKLPKYKPATTRNHLEGLANVLLAIDKNKFKEIVRPYYNLGLDLQKEIDKKRDDSELTPKEKENFVCYADLIEQRNKLHDAWMEKRRDKKLNIYHLILALNTYIPPLRLNLINMEFHRERKAPPSNIQTNYLWEKTKGKWVIVLNYDKIENKRQAKGYDREEFDLEDDIPGVTEGQRLNNIINDSLKDWKREFVLTGVRTYGEPMGKSSYDQALSTIFNPKKPTQNILRKSYINHFYNKNLPMSKLKLIARRMRHTVGVAMLSYKKVNINCPEPGDIEGISIPPKIDIPQPIKKVKTDYFNPSDYSKEYRKKNKEKLKDQRTLNYKTNHVNILRAKLLWNLNRGVVKTPRTATIEKYDLKYNTKMKVWE